MTRIRDLGDDRPVDLPASRWSLLPMSEGPLAWLLVEEVDHTTGVRYVEGPASYSSTDVARTSWAYRLIMKKFGTPSTGSRDTTSKPNPA